MGPTLTTTAAGLSLQPLMGRAMRVALYSPGMVGLGHLRRNLLVAQALAGSDRPPVMLLLTEARESGAFAMPPGSDCVSLPALCKDATGTCAPRHLAMTTSNVVDLRRSVLTAALGAFDPDVLIVDHLPRGAHRELEPSLARLRARGGRAVLGLRDVLEEPAVVRREWAAARHEAAIRTWYDAVWVYGDCEVYDVVREVPLPPDIAAMVTYTGYLDSRARLALASTGADVSPASLGLPAEPLILCLLGGGSDGAHLAQAFLDATLPPGTTGLLVTGPFMPARLRRRMHALAAARPCMRVVDFMAEPALLMGRAARVITMGGYNGVCDVLSFGKPALVVPRALPRREQLIRARRLSALGIVDMLPPDEVTPARLSSWLAREPSVLARADHVIDMGGLARLPRLLEEVLQGNRGPLQIAGMPA
jgi:predicted glycosyltransferase